jgi:hypothetical protein
MKSSIVLIAIITTVGLSSTASFAEQKKAVHAGKSRAVCHKEALVTYPDPRTKAHQDAMARCMAAH